MQTRLHFSAIKPLAETDEEAKAELISYIMQQWCLVPCGAMVREAAQLYVMTDASRIAFNDFDYQPPSPTRCRCMEVAGASTLASSGRWSPP